MGTTTTLGKARDCSKVNGSYWSRNGYPANQMIGQEINYWPGMNSGNVQPGTVNGVACSYGSSPAESYCNCQYMCQQNSQCAAFEVYNQAGGQARCKLLSRSGSVKASSNGDFIGVCNSDRN